MKLEISIDDGSLFDLAFAEYLTNLNLRAVFYIPLTTKLSMEAISYISKEHYIGSHTVTHPMDMKTLSDKDLMLELEASKAMLEDITGRSVYYFCYPRGRFDGRVKKAVEKAGYKVARTTKVFNNKMPIDQFEVDPTVHFLPKRKEYEKYGYDIMTVFRNELEKARKSEYFHLWFHSNDIIGNDQLITDLFECLKILAELKENGDIENS